MLAGMNAATAGGGMRTLANGIEMPLLPKLRSR
jgi:hypothetical protein